jgi:hypothetical protein
MSRTYSDQTFGGKHTVSFGSQGASIDGTNQSQNILFRHTFMYPCKVIDWNQTFGGVGATDLTDVSFYIGKSEGGTGDGTTAPFGTGITNGTTATHAAYEVVDASCDETAFSAGDDVVFSAIGTIGQASTLTINLEVVETFEQADS